MKYLKLTFLFLIVFKMQAQEFPLDVNLAINDQDGIIHHGNSVQVFLSIVNLEQSSVSFDTEWIIQTDDWKPLKRMTLSHTIPGEGTLRADCPLYQFPSHGFYRIKVKITSNNGAIKTLEKVVGFDPEEIMAPLDNIPDLNAFWATAINDLAQIKPEFKVELIALEENSDINLYKVEMQSYADLTVRGWLEVPKKKGVYPVLLRVPGYQESMEPTGRSEEMIIFSFNTRDHGMSDDSEGGRNWDMWVRGFDDKENYYYKGLFLDCIRAVDYLVSREDVDKDRIAIWGGSQGGGLSFSTAALDDRIALCIADIPYMCDYPRYFEITYWKEVDAWFSEHPEASWETILHTLSYYDTKNLAHKIKCPVWMGIGLQDDVCPPATSFVTYNKIESEKNYIVYKNERHHQPSTHYDQRFKELVAFFITVAK